MKNLVVSRRVNERVSRPKGDHLKILRKLHAAVQRHTITEFCEEHGIGSTTLYQAVSPKDGNPRLSTLIRILKGLGYELTVRRRKA